ncbi:MAG: phenylalanine--tRNA ligase subunit beta [Bellilinea sp.]
MKIPLSWLKDYLEIELPLLELARTLTMAGLEVEEIQLVGLPDPYADLPAGTPREFKVSGLSWQPEKIVVAQIDEVLPHPNADRLVLCRLNDGTGEMIVLTGAPNLFEYKGKGPLPKPIKVAYAREGARIYDGHQPGQVLTTLKRAKIRGVESFSMVCSEKELGISDEHEGIIVLDDDAPTGIPLVDYMGDAVLEVSILPNMIRDASLIGVARELSALTGKPLRYPQARLPEKAPSMKGKAAIRITDPALNPRFVLGLIEGVTPRPSPYWVQRRLRLAGMRPINSVVDATNYVMLELGEPLHAFDYDVLVKRAGGNPPTIITRAAEPGEKLTTLDGVERILEPFTVLVCDTAGPLSLAGVMGGLESEVSPQTRTVLLEGAAWNFVNVRRTAFHQRLNSEAAYRFSRGVHPALAEQGVALCLQRMAEWSGGQVYADLVDEYPLPPQDPEIRLSEGDVRRLLGIELSAAQIAAILTRLEFVCRVEGSEVVAKTPPHRLDIGSGETGKADLIEEIARIYGYQNIPSTTLADPLPPPRADAALEVEEQTRQALIRLGLQEVINYRLTAPQREARLYPPENRPPQPDYITLRNPLNPERAVMRRSLLASVLDALEKNARLSDRLALFEIGPVFLPREGQALPDELIVVAIALTGLRQPPAWDRSRPPYFDFFDLKGILEALASDLRLQPLRFEAAAHPSLHPGKSAELFSGEMRLGVFGELHPLVKEQYDLLAPPVIIAELDMQAILASRQPRRETQPVPVFPPVLEDIAVIVDESVPAVEVEKAIWQGGGKMLRAVRLFDIYRGEQIGEGKKSLAYSLTYQADDHTLTAAEAAQIRQRIIRRLEQQVNAKLRG